MIRIILRLIAILDIEIQLLKKRKIREMAPWQSIEERLIKKLERQQQNNTIQYSIIHILHILKQKLQQKKNLIEKNLYINQKFFELLGNNISLYNNNGTTITSNLVAIMDKRI